MFGKLQAFLTKISPFTKHVVSGNSMEPLLREGDIIICNKLLYLFQNPSRDDVVVIKKSQDLSIIKRIQKEKNNRYFVVGDNQKESTDSRTFGWIARKNIIGKVIFINKW